MTDTERLNLIEHYQWQLHFIDSWFMQGMFGVVGGFNTLREAIDAALKAQFEWSAGR